ncbi:hypothetical protein PoB_006335700 [Plakobranchus ocellatus]|uniref:Uncharacterized protein n=1 Tax=Plakobranchus ocellatus TaxID=259542 RepID=A0AAV4CY68_9GAST|nr:hypothetical protein PoB_006335700 [Plakobranchus ocellatus]
MRDSYPPMEVVRIQLIPIPTSSSRSGGSSGKAVGYQYTKSGAWKKRKNQQWSSTWKTKQKSMRDAPGYFKAGQKTLPPSIVRSEAYNVTSSRKEMTRRRTENSDTKAPGPPAGRTLVVNSIR